MVNIKYKIWELSDEFSVQDVIDLVGDVEDPVKSLKSAVTLLESKRLKGPKITTKVSLKDFKKLQEKISEAFL